MKKILSHKILSLFLVFALLLYLVPTSVLAYDDCDHANAIHIERIEPSCYGPGTIEYWFCEECWCYFDSADMQTELLPGENNDYCDPNEMLVIPATGHNFTDDDICYNCGLEIPSYSKVTSLADINEEDMYIFVVEVGGKTYALGTPTLYDCYYGRYGHMRDVTGNDGNAVEVTVSEDCTINVLGKNVAEVMFDVNPEQWNMIDFGLTTVMPLLPSHVIGAFQSHGYTDMSYDYYGSPYYYGNHYPSADGGAAWVIDFYTTEVNENTYRDDMDGYTHAEQVARGNIGDNITEGDLLMYSANFCSVGGAMFTLRFREYPNPDTGVTEYYFICGEDWALEGSSGWDYVTDTTPTNDTQYAITLYRYDVPTINTHTCEFIDWKDNKDGKTHTGTCECGETETKNHGWDNGIETDSPSCTETGVKTYTCDDCDATKTEDISALNHDWSAWAYDNEDNHTHYCKRNCGVVEEFEKHTWGAWTPNGDANHKKTCTICNGTSTEAHDWDNGAITTEPTEDKFGVMAYTCDDCGLTKTEDIDKLEHVHHWSDWGQNNETTHISSCRCNETKTENHNFDNGVVINWATHLAPGEIHYTCTDCGYIKIDTQPELTEHEFGDWKDNGDGTHIRECLCGESKTANHIFDDGKVTNQPSHLEEGTIVYTCADCGATQEGSIDKTPEHIWGEWTIDENSSTQHYHTCDCGESEYTDCAYGEGKVVIGPSDFGEGDVIIYVCNNCTRQKIAEYTSTDNITNAEENITLIIPEDSSAAIDQNTVLQVEKVEEEISETAQENLEQEIGDNAESLATYDISMLLDGAQIQPGGDVLINLPLPEDMNLDDYTDITVVYIDDEGNVTPCETTVNEDGSITFVTDHFSCYSIVAVPKATVQPPVQLEPDTDTDATTKPEQQSPQTGDDIVLALAAVMFVFGFCLFTFAFSRKRIFKK